MKKIHNINQTSGIGGKITMLAVIFAAFLLFAGTAVAMDANILDEKGVPAPKVLDLAQGQSVNLQFEASNINPVPTKPFSLPTKVIVVPLTVGGSADDLTVTGVVNPLSIEADPTLVPFTVTNKKAPVGYLYRVTIKVGDEDTSVDFGAASRPVESIPEFPSVALPVGAVIGLIFLVQQKKRVKK